MKRSHALSLFVLSVVALLSLGSPRAAEKPAKGDYFVYIGTYTGPKSKGIYLFRLNEKSGEIHSEGLAGECSSPSFLALHPSGKLLYAANEVSTFDGKKTGAVTGFNIDRDTGKLTQINSASSGGSGPCHLVVDKTGRTVLVANYGGGNISAVRIEKDGKLAAQSAFHQHKGSSVNLSRQSEPHAHSINLDPANRFAVAADLGLDRVFVYRFDAGKGSLDPNDPPFASVNPGAGPRHFAFHPSARFAYVINEMQCTVTAFDYDAHGGILKPIQTITTLPAKLESGYSTAEVQVHPSGKFLYGSNRGHNSIAVFAIDSKTGRLTPVQNQPTLGRTPRNFGIDPTGKFLLAANQDSDNIGVFKIDQESGKLSATGQLLEAPTPVCVKFLKAR